MRMEITRSSQLQKFVKSFETTHGTLIPQYLKNLLDYCEYSEFTIRFFNADNIKNLEEFVKNEVSQMVSGEDWIRLTGGKFKESKRFVFFPPVKLLLFELAKFAENKSITSKVYKAEVEEAIVEKVEFPRTFEGEAIDSKKRSTFVLDEEENAECQPKKPKIEDCEESKEGKILPKVSILL